MIFYFSGTGNSLAVACRLDFRHTNPVLDIAHCMKGETDWQDELAGAEVLGIVCPVYAWGVPRIVERFVRDHLAPAARRLPRLPYIFLMLTCGDDVGMADRRFGRLLRAEGLRLDAAFSVAMPNTYVGLPGFDVDPPEVRDKKLVSYQMAASVFSLCVSLRMSGIAKVHRGACPRLKTYVLRPLFYRFFTSDRRFSVDKDTCTRCQRCVGCCPTGNIRPDDEGHPTWNGQCADCLRCYHTCPHHSIAYGRHSRTAGQYLYSSRTVGAAMVKDLGLDKIR